MCSQGSICLNSTVEDEAVVSPTAEAAVGDEVLEIELDQPRPSQELVARARKAQAAFEDFSQEQVDAIVNFGKYVYDNAENIAEAAHNETGLGTYEDKVAKAKGKARVIWNNLKGKKSRGIIGRGRVARIRGAGAMTPTPFWAHAMRTDSGRPSSSMRFRTWTATSISVARRSSVRERSPSPITRLNRPMVASARARAL